MGYWSSIDVLFEMEENWYDVEHVEYPPSIHKLNKVFRVYDFFNMPFGSEGIPEINITGDGYNKVVITISCRDEGVNEKDVVDWWYRHIWNTHATKARLIIKPDWKNDKLDLKYKAKVKTHEDVIKEERCTS